jgi:hypothetical protein
VNGQGKPLVNAINALRRRKRNPIPWVKRSKYVRFPRRPYLAWKVKEADRRG